jgi:hypothetical protein
MCRAWVNFNGTGTVAIRASGNVSSITDNGTGNYTVNFTTAMTDANYCVSLTAGDNASNYFAERSVTYTSSDYRFLVVNTVASLRDSENCNVAFFR